MCSLASTGPEACVWLPDAVGKAEVFVGFSQKAIAKVAMVFIAGAWPALHVLSFQSQPPPGYSCKDLSFRGVSW